MTTVDDLLSPKQVTSIIESDARINVWEGAIRSGKTIASLLRWLRYCSDPPPGGQLLMVGKTTATVSRNCFAPLQDPSIFGDLSRHVHYSAGAPTARILGRTVHVVGANDAKAESKIRGFTCAGSYTDELTLIPREFWNQLVGRHSVEGARLFTTTNPDNPRHWVKRDLLADNDDVKSWQFVMDDNPKLPAETKAFWRRQYTGLWFKRFILGQWVQAEGAVYDMWDEDRHVVDEIPQIIQWISVGMDYGTSNPAHALLVGLGLDLRVYVVSEWRYDGRTERRQLTDLEYSQRLRDWLQAPTENLSDVEVPYFVVDPSAASFIAQAHRDGLRPWPADNDVLDGIRLVSSLIGADKLRIHRRCTHLLDEIGGYCWDDRAALLGEDKPIKVDDHGVDALRYALKTTEKTWRHRVLPDAA